MGWRWRWCPGARTATLSGLTTFRLYMQTAHETDRVIAAVGDDSIRCR